MATMISKLDRSGSSKGQKSDNPLYGKKVLIVEDNGVQRKKLRELYESMGFVCVGECGNGLECLEQAEKTLPHLISLDILMPLMHGVETLGYLRDSGSQSVIVFVSALGSVDAITEVRSKGHAPDAVFSKKDTREMFLQVLQDIFLAEEERLAAQGPVEKVVAEKIA